MSLLVTIIFACAPFIAIPLIILGIVMDKKHNVIYGILLALLLAMIAYNFNPKEGHDLYRYYFEMDSYYSNIDFERFVERNMFNNTKFLFVILEFLVAQIGNNSLLQFIITFIGYAITFYIILDYSKLKDIKPGITLCVMLIFIFTFYHINFISGLAQYLAIVVGFLGFYLEYIKGKKKWFYKLLYIIPALIHMSMILIILLRLLLCFNYKSIKKYYILALIAYALLPSIVYQIFSVIPSLSMIAYKINGYMLNEVSIFAGIYDIGTLMLLILYMYIYYTSKNKLTKELPEKFIQFVEIVLLLNIFSIPYRSIFARILNLTILCINIYLLSYLKNTKNRHLIIILLALFMFCVVLGSVNFNNIISNDFNNIFSNLLNNITYYFEK